MKRKRTFEEKGFDEHQEGGERLAGTTPVVGVENAKLEEEDLEQPSERADYNGRLSSTSRAVSEAGSELKEEVSHKISGRRDEEGCGLAAAEAFLNSFEGYAGAVGLMQKAMGKNDSVLPEPCGDCDYLDPDVEMPDVSIKKQSPEIPAAQVVTKSPTPPDAEDAMVYRSPYFSKSTHITPEPKPEHIAKKTPFDWSQFASKRVVASEPQHDHDQQEEEEEQDIDGTNSVGGSAEQEEADQEIWELELAKSEYVLKLATLKRKETEAELGLLEVEQKLTEARGKRSRKE